MATETSEKTVCSLIKDGTLQLEAEVGRDPYYTGLVVSADMLMVADDIERKLQLHSRLDGKLLAASFQLKCDPVGMCLISNREVAVFLYDSEIEILSFESKDRIKSVKRFHVNTGFNGCHAVAKTESADKLVVSGVKRDDRSLYWCVVSLTDEHVDSAHQICKVGYRSHLAIKNDTVYISCNAGRHSPDTGVYSHSIISSERKFLYRHRDLTWPMGLTVDSRGYIFVCNWSPDSIHQLTERGEFVTIHRLSSWPWEILYEEQDKILYITHGWMSDEITRYRLEYSNKKDPIIPAEILKMDTRSLHMYKDALRDGKEKVYNIRVMVVGQFGVGKTTLTKRLLGRDIKVSDRDSTEGIDVHTECCKVSMATREWIIQEKDAEQYSRLQRLVKLLNERILTQESGVESNGQSEIEDQVSSEEGAHGHTQPDQPDIVKQNVSPGVKSTISQPLGTRVVNMGQESSIKIEFSENKNDSLMEIVQLVNKNSNKLEKNLVDYATLALWDFAGQYAFYTTHQTFLTSRAIYLLVIDLSQQVTDLIQNDECFLDTFGIKLCKVHEMVEMWLNSIHSCASSPKEGVPPVILVGTHVDKIPENVRLKVIDEYFMKLRYMLRGKPVILHLTNDIAIDNTCCDPKLDELKGMIFEVASKQTHWGEVKPSRWLPLEQAIIQLKASGIKVATLTLIEEINKSGSVRIEGKDELDLFLRFQHDIGMILYFSIERLREKIVLDPQWLIDALKSLITADMFVRKNPAIVNKWFDFKDCGILTQELIDSVWAKEKYPDLHANKDHILMIMQELHIIAKPRSFNKAMEKVEDYFIAPCMLRQATPEKIICPESDPEMESTSVICFMCTGKFLPSPIFHRLVGACLTHWAIANQNSQNLIYCGCCVFDLDHYHRLTLHFRDYVIFARVTRMVVKDTSESSKLCSEARTFIFNNLTRIVGNLGKSLEFESYIQCPNSKADSLDGLIPLPLIQKNERVVCHFHDKSHTLLSRELCKFWFEEEQPQKLENRESSGSAKDQEGESQDNADTPITQEHINHARLCNALTTVCADALREILVNQVPVPYANIYQVILAKQDHLTCTRLLNNDQIDVVFPDLLDRFTGTVDQFDISLLYTIIRSASSVPVPATGWGNPPTDQPRDTTLGASVERIRLCRNKVSGHSVDGKISETEFKDYWQNIVDILRDIETIIGDHGYQGELERRRNQVITPHEAREQRKKIKAYIAG